MAFIGQGDFQFNFWNEFNLIFSASIGLFMTFLTTKSLHFGDSHALDTQLDQRIFHFI